MLVILWSVYS